MGATYGVVPFVNRRALGTVAGIVGAGGNAGAVAAGFLFRSEGLAVQQGFLYLGLAGTGISVAALAVRLAPEGAEGREPASSARHRVRLAGTALVVEDNLIIAMNAADALRGLGADNVLIAGTTQEALRLLDERMNGYQTAIHGYLARLMEQELDPAASRRAALAPRPALSTSGTPPPWSPPEPRVSLPVHRTLTPVLGETPAGALAE